MAKLLKPVPSEAPKAGKASSKKMEKATMVAMEEEPEVEAFSDEDETDVSP